MFAEIGEEPGSFRPSEGRTSDEPEYELVLVKDEERASKEERASNP